MSQVQTVTQQAAAPSAQNDGYVVQHGDTLAKIAAQHGVSLSELEGANPQIRNPNLIYPGEQVTIPGGQSSSGANGTSGPSGSQAAAPSGATPSTLQGREDQAMGYFMSQGWSREQAAGIVANLEVESAHTLDPHIQQYGGGPGYGIAQWEGPRQAQFQQVMGKDIHSASYGDELQFVQWELTHSESSAGNALRTQTSAYGAGSFLFGVTRADGVFSVKEIWTAPFQCYMSTPVVIGGHAYLHLRNKRLSCVDLQSGAQTWSSKVLGEYCSLVARGDRILALDQRGDLLLFRADPGKFDLVDSRKISDQETWGHLAVCDDQVFVRELKGIAAYVWR